MTLLRAAMWALGTHFIFLVLLLTTVSARPTAERDLFSHALCQLASYLLAVFLMLRLHAPEASVRRFVAWRPAHRAGFYVVAPLIGVAAVIPTSALLNKIEQRFPSEREADFAGLFFEASTGTQVLYALAVVLIGPVLEELLFRGALFGPLLERHRPRVVVLATATLFAVVHHDPRHMLPIFLVGAMLGYIRLASGSILPSTLVHVAFNGVQIAALVHAGNLDDANELEASFEPALVIAATLAVAGLLRWARSLAPANAPEPPRDDEG